MSTVRRYDTLEDMRADDAPLVGSKYRIAGLNHVARNIAAWRESKGFYSPRSFEETDQVIVKLALVMTEVAEAIEAARTGDFENFQEELADAIIRILDVGSRATSGRSGFPGSSARSRARSWRSASPARSSASSRRTRSSSCT